MLVVGVAKFDLVKALFGTSVLASIVYTLVGAGGIGLSQGVNAGEERVAFPPVQGDRQLLRVGGRVSQRDTHLP